MKHETARNILLSYGIDLKLLENFSSGCISVQNCILKLERSIHEHVKDPGFSAQDKMFKIMAETIAELSFRNSLSFRYAFELEQEKRERKTDEN